jgi:hypothetical protein
MRSSGMRINSYMCGAFVIVIIWFVLAHSQAFPAPAEIVKA